MSAQEFEDYAQTVYCQTASMAQWVHLAYMTQSSRFEVTYCDHFRTVY